MARVADPARRYRFVPRRLAYVVAIALGGAPNAAEMPVIAPRGPFDWSGLPITFERNDGQHEPAVLFSSRGPHGILTLRSGELAITPRRSNGAGPSAKLKLAGANPAPEVEPLRPLVTRSHYYGGSTTLTDVPHFGELRMKEVYPGIDVDLHGRTGALEYDFVVAPGADPNDIRLDLRDAQRAWIDGEGNLRLDFHGQSLMQRAPVAYQEYEGGRRVVEARFELVNGEAGPQASIALGAYDHRAQLTIDPLMAYSTYVGSSGADLGGYVAAGSDGTVHFAQMAFTNHQIAATRFDPASNTVLFQTYIGATAQSNVFHMALGSSGDMYVAGIVQAAVTSTSGYDAFVLRLDPAGHLLASQFIGGSGATDDFATGVALDPAGNVYVAGWTTSPDLPVTMGGPMNGGANTLRRDGFVAKFTPSLANLHYLRYVGGSGDDTVVGMAVDAAGQVVVVGATSGNTAPGPAYPPQIAPATGSNRGFATKLTADGAGVVYSQYVGGQSSSANHVAIDPYNGDAVVAGLIYNANLSPASARPYTPATDGSTLSDAFVLRLRHDGLPLWASYLGGSGQESVGDVKVDGRGDIYVTGSTSAADFPLLAPLAGTVPTPDTNVFVARFRNGELDFSTLFGGSGSPGAFDTGYSLSLGASGSLFVAGETWSSNFPTVSPMRSTLMGSSDGFVTQITGLDESRTEFEGDFNGDGKSDMLWQNADGSVAIWLMDGGTAATGAIIRPPGSGWRVALVADFNGDSRADLLWTREDGSAEVWLMNGTAVLGQRAVRGAGTGWRPVHAADFGGDGKADILWQHRDGSSEITMMKGALVASHDALLPGYGWTAKLVGDFNGDGTADILWRHEDGSAQVWLMKGGAFLAGGNLMPAGAWTPTHVGDFNGDGKDDILWHNANGSTMVTLMGGVNVMESATLTGVGSGVRVTHVGDLDADGRADIIVRGRGGSLAMWLMNGTSIVRTAQMTNTISRWVPRRVADFIGDHRAGIVLYDRGTTRVWFTNADGSPNIVQLRPSGSPWLPFGFDE